jgi:CO dehydrogenase maturation factor
LNNKGLKLAISGKGGVGKTTFAACLCLLLAQRGKKVLAVDADPDANLASALGIPGEVQKKIVPIADQRALIEERTGARVRQYGQMFKLNPEVSDVADKFAFHHRDVALLVLGAIESGGSGCACPESILLKSLVTNLVLYKNDALILDMEAGVEHLGRATAQGVDAMIIVVEPGQRSIESARRIADMAGQIGIKRFLLVANKITGSEDESFIRHELAGLSMAGIVPFSETLRLADRDGIAVFDVLEKQEMTAIESILWAVEAELSA